MPQYTIRIYGLWINEKIVNGLSDGQILLSDERIGETVFTKFPGGGMDDGEGTIDCLKREWREELGVDIEIISHFYTTDFYQASAFHTDTQVISIYYLVKPNSLPKANLYSNKNDFPFQKNKEEIFRFVSIEQLTKEDVTYPIDQFVIGLLQKKMLAD